VKKTECKLTKKVEHCWWVSNTKWQRAITSN